MELGLKGPYRLIYKGRLKDLNLCCLAKQQLMGEGWKTDCRHQGECCRADPRALPQQCCTFPGRCGLCCVPWDPSRGPPCAHCRDSSATATSTTTGPIAPICSMGKQFPCPKELNPGISQSH